jgi:hypothetical protein
MHAFDVNISTCMQSRALALVRSQAMRILC